MISSITNYGFFYPTPELFWFVPIANGELIKEEADKQPSQFGITLFTYPEMGKEIAITKFTEIKSHQFERKKYTEYYIHLDLEGRGNSTAGYL
ncbi:MAG TPA: hypothetical protein VK616_15925 [Flavitalea sp.]|nr:hypothetical protein [Flavitalea sp.]